MYYLQNSVDVDECRFTLLCLQVVRLDFSPLSFIDRTWMRETTSSFTLSCVGNSDLEVQVAWRWWTNKRAKHLWSIAGKWSRHFFTF